MRRILASAHNFETQGTRMIRSALTLGFANYSTTALAATSAAAIASLWSLFQGGPIAFLNLTKCASMSATRSTSLAASNTFFASYQWTAQPRASAAAASALRYITQSATFCAV